MPEVGEVTAFAFTRAEADPIVQGLRKRGWIACEGQSVDQRGPKGLPLLYEVLRTVWGSVDPANVFNVPDLRGVFLRGWSHGSGTDPDASARHPIKSGGASGDAVASFQGDALQAHDHDIKMGFLGVGAGGAIGAYTVPQSPNDHIETQAANARVAPETRPKNASVMLNKTAPR
jgi:microcystin-dependent protein